MGDGGAVPARPVATRAAALAATLFVAACGQTVAIAPPPVPASEGPAQPVRAAAVASAAIPETDAARTAFQRACPSLLRRVDRSGLTRPEDWRAACADLAPGTFARHLVPVRLGDGRGLVTGYFEPEIAASLTPLPGSVPVLGRPSDLVEIDLGAFAPDLQGRRIRGRMTPSGFQPYPDRRAIEEEGLAGRAPIHGWAVDPIDLFFLQIQGSGRLRFPDGRVLRIGYAGQNGHPYVALGRLMREEGVHPRPGMAEIRAHLASLPDRGRAFMWRNPSYIFFDVRDPALDGPIGSLGVPLLPMVNAAADPATLPLGAPILLSTRIDGRPWRGLVIASDTGGAIRGPNRFDLFFGPGAEAARLAGALASPGEALILIPAAAAARLPAPP